MDNSISNVQLAMCNDSQPRKMKYSGVEWIGDIPAEWEVTKLLNILRSSISDGPHETPELVSENGIPFISVDSLNSTKSIDLSVVRKYISEKTYLEYSKKTKLEKGDILFSKSATIGKTAIVNNEKFMIWSPLAVIKVNIENIVDYIYYLLNCEELIKFVSLMGSHNTQFNVGMRTLERVPIPIPTITEQQSIAAILDRKCTQIDALIANEEQQIAKLKAYKQSVITETVTKGLNPDVPMKDSGVEWIGEIPEHWEIVRIKNKFSLRNERNYEADLSRVNLISLYTDLGVIQHSDLEETTGNKAVTAEGYKIVHEGDIIVNIILCWMGAVGKSNYNGVTSPAYDVYQPKSDTNSNYYHYLFRTKRFNGECYRYGRGIMMMRWRTYSTEFSSISIPVPPIEEQQQIADYLDKKCEQIDRLIAIKQQKIEKIQQYKKSVIYEYVTGKKQLAMCN